MSEVAADPAVLWKRMQGHAERELEREPLLREHLVRRVLSHPTLADALESSIVSALANEELGRDALAEVTRHILRASPAIVAAAADDVEAYAARDPSCESVLSPLLHYKGFISIQGYRIAHELWMQERRMLARLLQARVAEVFAVDIHPGARIGRAIFIDHGTGIVVGETSVVDDNVSMLHGVTLGGTGKDRGDRHPKIREGVLLGAGAAVLGNVEVGVGSKVAAGSVVLHPVPPHWV